MNVLDIYHDMEKRGVRLEIDGERLVVDAPAGQLTDDDKTNLAEFKHQLLKLLSERSSPAKSLRDHKRRFDARPSCYPGYTSLYDPLEGEWHDLLTEDCYPSVVELANKKIRKGHA